MKSYQRPEMLFCGIDIGTTNLKIALIEPTGRPVWVRSRPTPRRPAAGFLAVDGFELVEAIEALIFAGWQAVGRGRPLAALCATGVGEDGLYVDGRLTPLSRAIPWFDRSAIEEAQDLRRGGAATPRAGLAMDHTRTGARWLWFRRRFPEICASARHWLALTDFPAARWTGRPFISQTLAARTGCYDIGARAWIADLLDASGALAPPPVLAAGQGVGPVVSSPLLAHGVVDGQTLVVAGGHDHPVAASYIQRLESRARVDSIGTANVVYGETPAAPPDRLDPDIAFTVPVLAPTGTACLGVYEFSAAVAALERQGVDIGALLALPRLPGRPAFAPSSEPRAVFERAGFAARRMMERMQAMAVPDAAIFVTGGWSRSHGLVQLRASIFGRPLERLDEDEPAVVGAALLAAQACGGAIAMKPGPRPPPVAPDAGWAEEYDEIYRDMSQNPEKWAFGSEWETGQ